MSGEVLNEHGEGGYFRLFRWSFPVESLGFYSRKISMSTSSAESVASATKPTHLLSSRSTNELYDQFLLRTYGRFAPCFVRGNGCHLVAEDGQEYLDFGAGIAVCSLGHCHPAVTAAVAEQATRLVHVSNLYHTRPQAELAARLAALLRLEGRFFFCNSGAEANEGLIKLARRYGHATGGRSGIITFQGSFHGRTMAGISATGQDKVKTGFAPLLPGFVHVPFGDIQAVRATVDSQTVAILLEPIQGEGGIHPAPAGFLQSLRSLCDDADLLLLYDEVQCGLGRTGDWCGWRSLVGNTAEPDAVSWAKGIANGFPLGAFWIGNRRLPDGQPLSNLFGPGSHGTTYGGNLVCCAAALAVLDTIERENLLEHVLVEGAYLREALRDLAHSALGEVRAIGLMLGVALQPPEDFPSSEIPSIALTRACLEQRLLVIPAGERVVRFLPPLNVTREDIQEALTRFAAALSKCFGPSA